MDLPNIITAFDKVKKTIESCVIHQHLLVADRMIDNFIALYGFENEYISDLNSLWLNKLHELYEPKP